MKPRILEKMEAMRRYRNAQQVRLDWRKAVCPSVRQVVLVEAQHAGVPPEFIFVPLLSVGLGLTRGNAAIKMRGCWSEPAVLWTALVGQKGLNKSGAQRALESGVQALQEELTEKWREEGGPETDPEGEPCLLVNQFSFEKLHELMQNNNNSMIILSDELEYHLNSATGNGNNDRKTLLSLAGGSSWNRNFKCASGKMATTALNLTGFIQPLYMVNRMDPSQNHDGFIDRFLVCAPPPLVNLWEGLGVECPRHVPDLHELFKMIWDAHKEERIEYTMDAEAAKAMGHEYNRLALQGASYYYTDDDKHGYLAKMRGILGRLVLALHILSQVATVTMASKLKDQEIDQGAVESQWRQFTSALPERLPDASSQESTGTGRPPIQRQPSTSGQSVDGSITPALSEISEDSNDTESVVSESATEVPNPYLALVPTPEELQKPLPDVTEGNPPWQTQITVDTVERAIQLGRYFVQVYFKLLGSCEEMEEATPDLAVYAGPSNAIPYDGDVVNRYATCIKRLLTYGPSVTTSEACARKLIPSVRRNGKASYRKEDAKAFFTLVASAGLGNVVEDQNGGRTVIKMKRVDFDSIPESVRERLQLERY